VAQEGEVTVRLFFDDVGFDGQLQRSVAVSQYLRAAEHPDGRAT
jgi:hypothetical protein